MKIVVNGEKFNLEDLEFLGKTYEGLLAIAVKDKSIIFKNVHTEDFNANFNKIFNSIKKNANCKCFKFKGSVIINLANLDNYLIETTKKDDMLKVTFMFSTGSFKLEVSAKEIKKFIKEYNKLEKEEENVFTV